MNQIINIAPIGEVIFIRSKKAKKNISIKIDSSGSVRVSYPYHINIREAKKLVNKKKDWIKKSKKKFQNHKTILNLVDGDILQTLLTKFVIIRNTKELLVREKNNTVCFHIPNSIKELEHHKIIIQKFIIERLRNDAKKYILPQLKLFSQELKMYYNQVRIKNVKSRWGSCSIQNNLNFNLNLMLLSKDLIDYVILHELAHTVEKNHGKKFWLLLNKLTDNKARILDKHLNNFSIGF